MELLECEICGKRVSKLYKVEIEGSIAMVCEECKAYGKEVKEEKKKAIKRSVERGFIRKHYHYEEEEEVVVEGFGNIIKEAIKEKGYDVEGLARKLGMKESYLRRIINEDITPPISDARRIERTLGIRLVEKVKGSVDVESSEDEKKEKGEVGMTLGDILKEALSKKGR